VISRHDHAEDDKDAFAIWRSDPDYSYRGEELAGFNFLDFLVDTSEIDIAQPSEDGDEDKEMLDF